MAHDGVLIIVGDLQENKQKDAFSNAIVKGLEFWNSSRDLNEVVKQFVASDPSPVHQDGFDADDRSMRFSALECELEVLINPGFNTLSFALETMMRTELHHRLIVFAGPVAARSGDWLLRDSLLSAERFAALLKEITNSILTSDAELRVAGPILADWRNLKAPVTAVKADDYQASNNGDAATDNTGFIQIAALLADLIQLPTIEQLFTPSTVVGNVRFEKPTMYVFPEGNGDSALFGVEGFNLLVNCGYAQSPGFWQFVKHVDRLDALLLTHWGLDNLAGVRNFLSRKMHSDISPELGFALVPPCRPQLVAATPISNGHVIDGSGAAAVSSDLEVNLTSEATSVLTMLKNLNVATEDVRRQATSTINATILYSKIGHGTLELYPLNPLGDAKELKEFQAQLYKGSASFSTVKVGNALIPLPNVTSLAALLVWKPAKPSDAIIRILFTGNSPQAKIFEAIDKLKHLEFLKHPTYCHADAAVAQKQRVAPPVSKTNTASSKPASAPPTSRSAPSTQKSASPDPDGDKPTASRARASAGLNKRPKPTDATVASTKEDGNSTTQEKKAALPAVAAVKKSAAAPPQRCARETNEKTTSASSKTAPRVAASKSSATTNDSKEKVAVKSSATASDSGKEKAPSKSRPTSAPQAPGKVLKTSKAASAGTKAAANAVSDKKAVQVKKESIEIEGVKEKEEVGDRNLVEFVKEASVPISDNSCLSDVDANANRDEDVHHTVANHHNVDLVNVPMEASLYEPEAVDDHEHEEYSAGDSRHSPSVSDEGGLVKENDEEEAEAESLENEELNNDAQFNPAQQWGLPQALPALPDEKKATPRQSSSGAGAPRKTVAVTSVEKPINYGPVTPIYVNLAYVPAHGDQRYVDVEFFKRVRARYYVLSAVEANPLTLDAVLDGKEAWGSAGRELLVTVVPTYDNQLVLRWLNANRERLEEQSVDLTPAAARCKIQLQDQDDGTAFAYRIEF